MAPERPRSHRAPACRFPAPPGRPDGRAPVSTLVVVDDVPEALKDAGYVLVGLGVVWFQRAQVLRREFARDLPDLREPVTDAVRGVVGAVKSALEGTPLPRPEG